MSLLRRLLGTKSSTDTSASGSPHRRALEYDPRLVIEEIEARIASLLHENRALRRKLGEKGIPQPPGICSRHLILAVEVLEGLAEGRHPELNSIELTAIAESVRATATYGEW